MSQDEAPDFSFGEFCIVVLIVVSVISALISQYSLSAFALSISLGLIAIALAILITGRQLQTSSPD